MFPIKAIIFIRWQYFPVNLHILTDFTVSLEHVLVIHLTCFHYQNAQLAFYITSYGYQLNKKGYLLIQAGIWVN